MTGRPLASRRSAVVRPVVATGYVVASGAVAHASGGGGLPGAEVLLPMVALVGAVCAGLRRGLVRFPVAVTLVAAGQLALHVAASTPADHGAHGATSAAPSGSGSMMLAHAVATVVTVMALMWQERAVLALLRGLVPLGRGLPPLSDVVDRVWSRAPFVVAPVRVLMVAPRRGPPAATAAAC